MSAKATAARLQNQLKILQPAMTNQRLPASTLPDDDAANSNDSNTGAASITLRY